MNFFLFFQMVNLVRPQVVSLNRRDLVSLNRRQVVSFTGAYTVLMGCYIDYRARKAEQD